MKAAVYQGTRNIYQDMIPSMKSLLIHSDVDKVYFLIEDDEFPYELPPEVECINVSNQEYFKPNGPNYNSSWGYMVLLRAALPKIFPFLDKILSIDYDVIIKENISDLWDISLDGYYIAGVKEKHKSNDNRTYINNGVLLFNLKAWREDGIDNKIINDLNTYYRFYSEQDCFNDLLQEKILELPADYNVNNYSYPTYNHIKCLHYAAIKNWEKFPLVEKYKNMNIIRNQTNNINLDIIIPYYNNIEGLEKTLESVVFPELSNIHITVVDDCSIKSCDEIKEKYPTVNFLRLEQNSGPGIARQYGIEHTNSMYIMFIDTGDYILSKYNLIEVLSTITNNTVPYMYLWRWLNAEHNSYSSSWNPLLHGWVIKREFIEMYGIKFCAESSRSNEDVGFIQSCLLMIRQLKLNNKIQFFKFNEAPIYMYTYDPESITHANNKLYMYTTHIKGLCINAKHVFNFGLKNNVDINLLVPFVCEIMITLYQNFLDCIVNKPEYAEQNWKYIQDYYKTVYKQYEKINQEELLKKQSQHMTSLLKICKNTNYRVNIRRFLYELDTNEVFNI